MWLAEQVGVKAPGTATMTIFLSLATRTALVKLPIAFLGKIRKLTLADLVLRGDTAGAELSSLGRGRDPREDHVAGEVIADLGSRHYGQIFELVSW